MSNVVSPSSLILYAAYLAQENGQEVEKIAKFGTAINMMVNTVRGKVPIYTFGKTEPVAIVRGAQFVYGSIDQLILTKLLLDMIIEQQKSSIYEIDLTASSGYAAFGGLLVGAKSIDEEMDVDNIRIKKLVLFSLEPDVYVGYKNEREKDGKKLYDIVKGIVGITFELYDVEFYGYSYLKRTTDVLLLTRVNFLARLIKVADEKWIETILAKGVERK